MSKNGQSAAKSQIEKGSTTRVEILVGRSLPKWNTPKFTDVNMVNDMVCTLLKDRENLLFSKSIRSNEPSK